MNKRQNFERLPEKLNDFLLIVFFPALKFAVERVPFDKFLHEKKLAVFLEMRDQRGYVRMPAEAVKNLGFLLKKPVREFERFGVRDLRAQMLDDRFRARLELQIFREIRQTESADSDLLQYSVSSVNCRVLHLVNEVLVSVGKKLYSF